MDEMEKELLPEEQTDENMTDAADKADEIAEAVEGADEQAHEADPMEDLYEELEELKDMFQKELDEASEKAEQGELIQELSDFEEEHPEDIEMTPEEKCECCEENPRATEFGEDYPYCSSCREFMKHYPLRKTGVLMFIIMIVVFIGTIFTSFTAVDTNIYLLNGYANHMEGNVMSAIENYYYYTSSVSDNVSMRAVRNLIEDYTKTGYMSDAVTLINKYYSETDLKMPWNSKYRKIVEETEINTETYYAVSEIVSGAFSGEEFDYEAVMAQLDALREETDENGERKYADLFIDYFSYEIMRLNGEPIEDRLAYLTEMDKKHKGNEWVYLPTLCQVAAMAGDGETAEDCYNRLIKINKQDSNAYIAYSNYFRYLETPDPDKIIEICSEAAANAYSSDVSYKQCLAVAYLLKGEGSMALEAMEEFMNSGSYNVAQCNLYALIGLYNGNTDVYDSMKNVLETNGYELSELVEKYKDGKMTIEEVLMDKGGDIA
ncbi:MAG: hypothetical protein IJ491_08550 [Clostridia bacterium]|nr:hypothetical protein [Clostridia bacterium]